MADTIITTAAAGEIPWISMTEADGITYLDPSAPAAGLIRLWPTSTGLWKSIDSSSVTRTLVDTTSTQTMAAKTLTTPTIASFTNATHDHTNAAGGGQLTDAALSAAVTVPKGGTGLATLTAHAAMIGNGASAVTFLAPSTSRNVMISDGTDWSSRALVDADIPDALTISGGTINNSIIGGVTPAAVTGTTGIFTVVKLTGTAGAGFFEDIAQSSAPAAPASGFRLYAGSSHQFRWIGQGGFVTTLDTTANSADRVYTFPNLTDNVLTDTSTSTLTNKTHTAPIITGGSGFRPTADSTTAINFYKADGVTPVIQIDTTDSFLSIGPAAGTPTKLLDLYYGDLKFNQITAPVACTAALNGLGGSVDAGTHIYKVTFVNAAGETSLGTASNTVTNDASNTQNSLTAIPTGVAGQGVTSRKVYRTKAGSATYFLLATIANNTTTTLADTTADASLGATDFTNRNNSTAGTLFIGATKIGYANTNLTAFGNNAMPNAQALGALNSAAFGNSALGSLTTGNGNMAVGPSTLFSLTVGQNDTAIGFDAAFSMTGSRNTTIGSQASWTTGSTPASGNAVTSGTDNTHIGFQAGFESSTQRSFAIAIGSGASVDASNTCIIGGTTTTNAVSVGVGRTTVNAALHFTKLDAGTNAVLNVGILDHKSSGTPAANYGTGFLLTGQDSTTADVEFGRLRYYWSTATHASRAARGVLSVYDTAERDCITIGASGTAPMISFLSVTTPIVQTTAFTQTYATSSHTTANPTATSVVTTGSALASYGYTQAQADDIVTELNRLITDVANAKNNINAIIDDIQAYGLFG